MPNGPPTIPFVVNVTLPFTDCITGLNDLIAQYDADGFVLVTILPCPGKNYPGASNYHWLVVFKPKVP